MDTGVLVGLRVDVDTYRGTRDGVPALLKTFADHNVHASFFFSVGPDNMGRHLWRLANPKFLAKMLRSKAASLYGWDILLRGVAWPGPNIGKAFPDIIRETARSGHEVGLHAWDHHAWQSRLPNMTDAQIDEQHRLGMEALRSILGEDPTCSAAAGWICNELALRVKERFATRYNSDCRGTSVFRPLVDGDLLTPQIPVTLPTYDEVIGRDGITDDNFNAFLLDRLLPGQLNVLTVHAEVEGMIKNRLFRDFLGKAEQRGIRFAPLGQLLGDSTAIPAGTIMQGDIPGRSGHFCSQAPA